ncbi:MAG: ABC transporter ATP-binding protein [Trichlorobacter sp.]|uniref:ABC transporter ATP-binding protein n=1 Tax=Trichlorobacter sp. TaxID=2911007 RepID=UPI002561037F|nr:ABC transporter ATP-binding protein [Trichlorobacter sp.]MDK9719323.1 ABC transporter ATP-binding protein [Trichlorobacter sp.]
MIRITNLVKQYPTRHGQVTVLDHVNLTIQPGEKVGILGRNGSGKSTLVRLISGAEHPTSGTVERSMSVSWPLAFFAGFQGTLTGFDNLRLVCRIYGVDFKSRVSFVQEFSELGKYLKEPVKTYSAGMRSRLAFAISMSIEFDCFLIDEITAVGDSRFHEKCNEELFGRRGDRAMIVVSHQPEFIREHCDHAAVLVAGKLHKFDQIDEAMQFYHDHLASI